MTLRHRLRLLGNLLMKLVPRAARRMIVKGLSDQPWLAEECGFQVLPKGFYSPLPELDLLRRGDLQNARRVLPGLDLRMPEALELVQTFVQSYAAETAAFPRHRTEGTDLWLENGNYEDFDTCTLYSVLRHLKPKRYIEIGCGFSSQASTLARRRNAAEGAPCEAIYVEPYPSETFLALELGAKYERRRVEELPLDFFAELAAGDVLFVDTSHVLKAQNDVEFELLRVLPSLAPGVWVHIHDIFTPWDYPDEWLYGAPRMAWNEQYAVECFLSGGTRWEVQLPLYSVYRDHRPLLDPLCPSARARPAAFWIRRTNAP